MLTKHMFLNLASKINANILFFMSNAHKK
jgi:hypothetical protein